MSLVSCYLLLWAYCKERSEDELARLIQTKAYKDQKVSFRDTNKSPLQNDSSIGLTDEVMGRRDNTMRVLCETKEESKKINPWSIGELKVLEDTKANKTEGDVKRADGLKNKEISNASIKEDNYDLVAEGVSPKERSEHHKYKNKFRGCNRSNRADSPKNTFSQEVRKMSRDSANTEKPETASHLVTLVKELESPPTLSKITSKSFHALLLVLSLD
jgi:hypothetical protein